MPSSSTTAATVGPVALLAAAAAIIVNTAAVGFVGPLYSIYAVSANTLIVMNKLQILNVDCDCSYQ